MPPCLRDHLLVIGAACPRVIPSGDFIHPIQYRFGKHFPGRLDAVAGDERQPGLASAIDHPLQVGLVLSLPIGIAWWTVIDQAGEQEQIDQSHGVGIDPIGRERVDVHAAHLDIFDALARECNDRRLTALRHAFGPDRAVILIFDLQQ